MDRRRRAARTVALMSLFTMADTRTDVPIASFDGDGSDLISLIVGIEPVQDLHGYSNPWPAGGGKNICPPDGWEQGQLQADGLMNIVYYAVSSPYILLTGGQTYTLSRNYPDYGDGQMAYHTYDLSKTHLSDSGWKPNNYAFTPESDCYIRITTRAKPSNEDPPALTPNDVGTMFVVQLELGSTATSYAPYSNICPISGWTGANIHVSPTTDAEDGTTYSITFPASAGTVYGGTLDVTTGKLTVDKVKTSHNFSLPTQQELNGRWVLGYYLENVSADLLGKRWEVSDPPLKNLFRVSNLPIIREDLLTDTDYASVSFYGHNNGVEIRPRIMATQFSAEEAQAIASSMEFVYPINPIEITLTPTQVTTLIGTNNIWADTGDIKYIEYNI